ncbi:MAG: nitroreductase family protein [Eubacteriales bacterium]|nr:nitroreductase family protein [Eubacteriales bacterium]
MKEKAYFEVDRDKCIGCGQCIKVCPGAVLEMDKDNKPVMKEFDAFGWNGCWKCEHCLAVCPVGAISIFHHKPEESMTQLPVKETAPVIKSVIANRHTCRRFIDKDVSADVVNELMDLLANAPNGGNKQQVEFTLIDDKDAMKEFRDLAYTRMDELATEGIYPEGFDKASFEDMKRWEKTVRPDMLFCGAPHLLIPHVPLGKGEPVPDAIVASAYFEILCNGMGLGCAMLTFPLGVLNTMPEVKKMLNIPEDHYIPMLLAFGYPEIKYRRGVQKKMDSSRIHRPFQKTQGGENK